jgi:hypothetical protein
MRPGPAVARMSLKELEWEVNWNATTDMAVADERGMRKCGYYTVIVSNLIHTLTARQKINPHETSL